MSQPLSHWPAIPPPIELPLVEFAPHECSYLPLRLATTRAFLAREIPAEVYHRFMDAGFRRSGEYFYQPICAGCRQCVPIRVPVDGFRPSKSQRRCARRNRDLTVTCGEARISDEKFALYTRYKAKWHGQADATLEELSSFLYTSPVNTIEFEYRDGASGGRLLGVGICDICPLSLSSVYFYFDPSESQRGLGTFSALREIEFARERGIPFYYLGYYVAQCRTMSYKSTFRPNQMLGGDGIWRDSERSSGEFMPSSLPQSRQRS